MVLSVCRRCATTIVNNALGIQRDTSDVLCDADSVAPSFGAGAPDTQRANLDAEIDVVDQLIFKLRVERARLCKKTKHAVTHIPLPTTRDPIRDISLCRSSGPFQQIGQLHRSASATWQSVHCMAADCVVHVRTLVEHRYSGVEEAVRYTGCATTRMARAFRPASPIHFPNLRKRRTYLEGCADAHCSHFRVGLRMLQVAEDRPIPARGVVRVPQQDWKSPPAPHIRDGAPFSK